MRKRERERKRAKELNFIKIYVYNKKKKTNYVIFIKPLKSFWRKLMKLKEIPLSFPYSNILRYMKLILDYWISFLFLLLKL